jgi:hypothetical protein
MFISMDSWKLCLVELCDDSEKEKHMALSYESKTHEESDRGD